MIAPFTRLRAEAERIAAGARIYAVSERVQECRDCLLDAHELNRCDLVADAGQQSGQGVLRVVSWVLGFASAQQRDRFCVSIGCAVLAEGADLPP